MACFSSRVENLLTKRIDEEDELQKDFSHSRQHRFRCACVNFWASKGFLKLQAAQIQVRMRQLLCVRKTFPTPGSTDSGAHASTSEPQKDISHSRQHRFRCACVNFWASEGLLPFRAAQIQVRMLQLLSLRRTSPTPGSTDLGAHASTSELQKDFSHSGQHRFRCSCVNFWASEGHLPLHAAQIQLRMCQLLSFRRTSPNPGSTDSVAHASTCELLQKDFSFCRKYRARCVKLWASRRLLPARAHSFKCACSEVLYVYITFVRNRNQEKAAKLSRNLGPPTSVLHIANIPEGLGHHDIKVSCISESAKLKLLKKFSLRYRARKINQGF